MTDEEFEARLANAGTLDALDVFQDQLLEWVKVAAEFKDRERLARYTTYLARIASKANALPVQLVESSGEGVE